MMLKGALQHPYKLGMGLLWLALFYDFARVLALHYAIRTVQVSIDRYPANFPHEIFKPMLYGALLLASCAGLYLDWQAAPSGANGGFWKYILPLPLTIRGRLYRMVGVPVYACVVGVVEAVRVFRDPETESDFTRLVSYLQTLSESQSIVDEEQIRALIENVQWRRSLDRWSRAFVSEKTLEIVRLPVEILLVLAVTTTYGIWIFSKEPRHDGDELREAARNNDLARVRRILARGVNPNSTGSDGSTSLHICAQQATPNTAELLLANHADPNLGDRLGFTPLHWAVQLRREETSQTNRLELIRLLLRHGANAHKADPSGTTPLAIASKKENAAALEVVREILEQEEEAEEGNADVGN